MKAHLFRNARCEDHYRALYKGIDNNQLEPYKGTPPSERNLEPPQPQIRYRNRGNRRAIKSFRLNRHLVNLL